MCKQHKHLTFFVWQHQPIATLKLLGDEFILVTSKITKYFIKIDNENNTLNMLKLFQMD